MSQTCPRCGSDAAVTWTTAPDGTHYTCRFSHGSEGPVSWTVPTTPRRATRPAAARRPASGSASPRERRKPAVAVSAPAAPPLTVNERGLAAVVDEVTRRGGQAQVQQAERKREVVVTGPAAEGEARLLVRTRTAGDWQARASDGEPRAAEEHPTAFWVLVHLGPGSARCYVMPEWWIRNDIYEKHEDYLRLQGRSRAMSGESAPHAIRTERVAQWLGRWDQLPVLPDS